MGSLLALETVPVGTPTRGPVQSILETSSLVHHKNAAGEGPVVSYLSTFIITIFLKFFLVIFL